ncbi:hypothetical protein [Arthrobacter mangrovi]|uniref:Nuclear transport factor 2 family protein n=1 Tax=Arthrobacter mangrovi TaxID=2966350 RepID=A0ABQ5MUV7_9MICC|nr:hypothetical protein [Arthrobacter mangrovi]GLB67733.1 hypothetical protein AHIS1636_21730 [Arthrobacter mangrovi]
MDPNLPPDVHRLPRRHSGRDLAPGHALPDGPAVRDAVEVAALFCEALLDRRHYRATLESLVVPGSLAGWGDFSAAARIMEAIPEPEYLANGTQPDRGAVEVAVRSTLPAGTHATVEMVWQERIGAWLVAGMASAPA